MVGKLLLARHAQSQGNKDNVFTGLTDLHLSDQGRIEAAQIAATIRARKLEVDVVYTSALSRTRETAELVLDNLGISAPIVPSQALNERDYGELTGMNKDTANARFGAEQVRQWRRSYEAKPPGGESLADTKSRVVPYFEKVIVPQLQDGKTVLVVAHGNSLRALVMYVEHLTPAEIEGKEIATGEVIVLSGVVVKSV